jgi:hypothetical protein
MKQFFIFLALFATFHSLANVNFIDITKISNDAQHVEIFNNLKENQHYYSQWTNDWNFEITREEVIQDLRDDYAFFSKIELKNTELHLLLGDISHYLYNLDDTIHYRFALKHYKDAIESDPKDYRSTWFLAYHYSLSNLPNQGMEQFFEAEKLLPKVEPAEFWSEYALASTLANMPSHASFAMAQVKKITGAEGTFEQQLGASIYKKLTPLDKNKFYKKEEIWQLEKNEKLTFTCRPMGIQFSVDSTWNLTINDYKNQQAAFIINPPTIKSKKGKDINYTILTMMKVPKENENIEANLDKFTAQYSKKNKIPFSQKYEKILAYEIKDKSLYPELGGAHMYIIGVEKDAPKYPGLLFEKPMMLPQGAKGKANYYQAPDPKNRFQNKLFYIFILDSCEEIHESSLAVFKDFFEKQILIE